MFGQRTVNRSRTARPVGGLNTAVEGTPVERRGMYLAGMDITLEQWDALVATLPPDARPSERGAWSPALETAVVKSRHRDGGRRSGADMGQGRPRSRRRWVLS